MSNSCPSRLLPEYNILVLGETQSGKSTLIQCMKKYADPSAIIDTSALGTSLLSHTVDVHTTSIITNLPEYYVVNTNGDLIDYRKFITMPDENDYHDALNMRYGLELQKGDSRQYKPFQFNLIDTPGLNATGGDDEKHVQKIFGSLTEAKTIHLILIAVSSGPFTQGLQDAIRCYVNMFPGFNGIIAFVHTRFDYKSFHPTRVQAAHAIDRKVEHLHRIAGRVTFPHFKIDCNINNKRPIRECITKNTIQKILELAIFNRPVGMLYTVVNKTRKMRDIDNFLRLRFESAIADIEGGPWLQDLQERELLAEIFHCETIIHKLETRIRQLDEFFIRHNVALPEVLHEERLDMEYGAIDHGQVITVYYQETGMDISIESRDLLCHEIQVVREIARSEVAGPWRSWQVDFQTKSLRRCLLHVKIYTTKSKKYRTEIKEKSVEYWDLQCRRQIALQHRDTSAQPKEKWPQQIKDIVDDHAEKVQVLGFLANEFLMPDVFRALMDAEVYIGDTAQCIGKVQRVYTDLAKRKESSTFTTTNE